MRVTQILYRNRVEAISHVENFGQVQYFGEYQKINGPVSDFGFVVKALLAVLAEFEHFVRDHVKFHSRYPYVHI